MRVFTVLFLFYTVPGEYVTYRSPSFSTIAIRALRPICIPLEITHT